MNKTREDYYKLYHSSLFAITRNLQIFAMDLGDTWEDKFNRLDSVTNDLANVKRALIYFKNTKPPTQPSPPPPPPKNDTSVAVELPPA